MTSTRPGFHTVTPYVCVEDAAGAIDFYTKAFDAEEPGERMISKDGRVGHAEIRIGDSPIMLVDEHPEWSMLKSANSLGGSAINLFLYVEDADAVFERAVGAGCEVLFEMQDKDYGRFGGVRDPYGLTWWITTHRDR